MKFSYSSVFSFLSSWTYLADIATSTKGPTKFASFSISKEKSNACGSLPYRNEKKYVGRSSQSIGFCGNSSTKLIDVTFTPCFGERYISIRSHPETIQLQVWWNIRWWICGTNLQVNLDKTHCVHVREETTDRTLENNKTIGKCNDYKHLGTDDKVMARRANKSKKNHQTSKWNILKHGNIKTEKNKDLRMHGKKYVAVRIQNMEKERTAEEKKWKQRKWMSWDGLWERVSWKGYEIVPRRSNARYYTPVARKEPLQHVELSYAAVEVSTTATK